MELNHSASGSVYTWFYLFFGSEGFWTTGRGSKQAALLAHAVGVLLRDLKNNTQHTLSQTRTIEPLLERFPTTPRVQLVQWVSSWQPRDTEV